ncbi:hypothetical protein ASF36_23855 [Methylobacterium sp. Leaf90]|nr:hypothetical protein ASF36_23855 [Methylobacterium sp. Leaf90]
MGASVPFSAFDEGELATLLGQIAVGIRAGNAPLHGKADEASFRRLNARLMAEGHARQASALLRDVEAAGSVIEEPRVPRRPPLGGDPTRPVNGERLPPGRYHP